MKTVTLSTLQAYKQAGETFSCLTAYDASFAHVASQAGIDVLLVGDSLGMVLQGHNSTLPVTIDDIVYHSLCIDVLRFDGMRNVSCICHYRRRDILYLTNLLSNNKRQTQTTKVGARNAFYFFRFQ